MTEAPIDAVSFDEAARILGLNMPSARRLLVDAGLIEPDDDDLRVARAEVEHTSGSGAR